VDPRTEIDDPIVPDPTTLADPPTARADADKVRPTMTDALALNKLPAAIHPAADIPEKGLPAIILELVDILVPPII